MKLKVKRILFFLVPILWSMTSLSYAEGISSNELISKAHLYDGKDIVYEGEIIGERMCRGEGCWLNVHDGNLAVGIWVPGEINFLPQYTGGYKSKGDWIQIKGVFNRSCQEHLGEMDIHAKEIRLIKEGQHLHHILSKKKLNLTIFIWGLLCLILISMRLKKT